MLHLFDPLRAVEAAKGLIFWSVILRATVAVVCGGLIGVEREHKRRPAGFRTHILICLGAAMTTMTSQFLYLNLHLFTDIARLGAQVIAGIGFIGAGTIIVTKQRQVKGLTTAAGLWTSAIIGLAAGAGYYEAAVIATLLIVLAEVGFSRIEYRILANSKAMNVLVEYRDPECLDRLIGVFKANDVTVLSLEIAKNGAKTSTESTVIFSLQRNKRGGHEELLTEISRTKGIISAEEL